MEFSVKERLMLLELLTKIEGNLLLLRQVRDLHQAVDFTEAEYALLEFKQDGPQLRWHEGRVPPLAVTIAPSLHAAISKLLQELDAAGHLGMQHLPVCDKFLPAAETPP